MNCSPRSNILQPSATFSSNKPLTLSLATKNQLVFRAAGDISSTTSSNSSSSSSSNSRRSNPDTLTAPGAGSIKKKSLPVRDSTAGGPKSSFGLHPPASVARRNARERNRVKQVNSGFNLLRQHIPILCGNTIVYGGTQPAGQSASNSKKNKMSKVETLRYAVEYIKNLEKLLAESDEQLLRHKDDSLVMDEGCYSPSHSSSSSSSMLSDENLSPDVVGANGSGNQLASTYSPTTTFYESSASPQASPQIATGSHPSSPAHCKFLFPELGKEELKQEILRALACYKEQDQFTADDIESILRDDTPTVHSGIQGSTVLDPLSSWWMPLV